MCFHNNKQVDEIELKLDQLIEMYMIDRRSATAAAAAAIGTSSAGPVLIPAVEQGDGGQVPQFSKKPDQVDNQAVKQEEEREVSFRTTTGESTCSKKQEDASSKSSEKGQIKQGGSKIMARSESFD